MILEGKDAFENIDHILSYSEINILYIGQYDLSMALGIPGKIDSPEVLQLMKVAVNKINKAGKQAGCMVHSIEEARKMIEYGFKFIAYQVDCGILFSAVNQFVSEVRGE